MRPRTPLLRPDRYFAQRVPDPVRGLILAVVVTLGFLVTIWLLGAVFMDRIDGTVAVDNPDRPPEAFCDDGTGSTFEEMDASAFDCDAPAQVDRDVDTILSDALSQFYGPILVGLPIVLLLAAAMLHVGTALFDADGGFGQTLTVTAWGFVPTLVVMPVSILALWAMMDPVTVSPGGDPAAFRDPVMASLERWRPVAFALNAVGSLWGAVVWTFGLESARSVTRSRAAIVAGSVTALFLLFGAL
ncbi:Yip1 domain-containing protein [Halomicrobium zhouii]|uniref:Yip1 domain-containing protein n=1 Tax=Halomicrobium zhouii TaxID=767519 RepID=A0A1I6LDL1_9EURY|nr:Yip1 family protein [Halomicrobium zhouii]SFS01506.1 Yip1 domain-containing protein [Halomicrobium zhouii]